MENLCIYFVSWYKYVTFFSFSTLDIFYGMSVYWLKCRSNWNLQTCVICLYCLLNIWLNAVTGRSTLYDHLLNFILNSVHIGICNHVVYFVCNFPSLSILKFFCKTIRIPRALQRGLYKNTYKMYEIGICKI